MAKEADSLLTDLQEYSRLMMAAENFRKSRPGMDQFLAVIEDRKDWLAVFALMEHHKNKIRKEIASGPSSIYFPKRSSVASTS